MENCEICKEKDICIVYLYQFEPKCKNIQICHEKGNKSLQKFGFNECNKSILYCCVCDVQNCFTYKLLMENEELKEDFEEMRSDATHLSVAIEKLRKKGIYLENQKLKKIILNSGITKEDLEKQLKVMKVNLFEWIW